jgi:hypothetical protein
MSEMKTWTMTDKFYNLPEAEQRLRDVGIPMQIVDALTGKFTAGNRNEVIAYKCRIALKSPILQTAAFIEWIKEVKAAAEAGRFRE